MLFSPDCGDPLYSIITWVTRTQLQVNDEQKTHKNPGLREGPKPFIKSGTPQAKGPVAPVAKPPRMQLEGKKWWVVRGACAALDVTFCCP